MLGVGLVMYCNVDYSGTVWT